MPTMKLTKKQHALVYTALKYTAQQAAFKYMTSEDGPTKRQNDLLTAYYTLIQMFEPKLVQMFGPKKYNK